MQIEDYRTMGECIRRAVKTERTVVVLEGGYHEKLGARAKAFFEGITDQKTTQSSAKKQRC